VEEGLVPNYRRDVLDLFGDGDRAVCRSRITGTTTGGAVVDLEAAVVVRVEGEQLIEAHLHLDPAAIVLD
jgi:hypothetical protein